VGVNSRLGRFTNMVNLLDLCAVAFPGPSRDDGLPFGVQLLAPAGHDEVVIDLAAIWCGEPSRAASRPEDPATEPAADVLIAVAGAHLTGQPLNHHLVRRGATLAFEARTAADYRMYLLEGPLPRPGLTRTVEPSSGPGLEVEIWKLPSAELAGFASTIAPPLAIGPLELSDGQRVLGFVCTADGADPRNDITDRGSWRAFLDGA
jgi:allophanate hydrolase